MKNIVWLIPIHWLILWTIIRVLCVACALIAWIGLLTAESAHQAWMFLAASFPGDLLIAAWVIDRGLAIRRRFRAR
jgi:hypothetical protein